VVWGGTRVFVYFVSFVCPSCCEPSFPSLASACKIRMIRPLQPCRFSRLSPPQYEPKRLRKEPLLRRYPAASAPSDLRRAGTSNATFSRCRVGERTSYTFYTRKSTATTTATGVGRNGTQ